MEQGLHINMFKEKEVENLLIFSTSNCRKDIENISVELAKQQWGNDLYRYRTFEECYLCSMYPNSAHLEDYYIFFDKPDILSNNRIFEGTFVIYITEGIDREYLELLRNYMVENAEFIKYFVVYESDAPYIDRSICELFKEIILLNPTIYTGLSEEEAMSCLEAATKKYHASVCTENIPMFKRYVEKRLHEPSNRGVTSYEIESFIKTVTMKSLLLTDAIVDTYISAANNNNQSYIGFRR